MRTTPEDLPPQQMGPAAWLGPGMAANTDWIETLSRAEVAELAAVAAPLAHRGAEIATLQVQDFPLHAGNTPGSHSH